ncbi:SusC/RagA family TonB-linked outer membrane protein [Hymenobacter jejuensis]|uniref:TonB-dependent receptor n=1 Tax=Hymenobacter jejuensis TaxID=2502781 RepID=A0A5B8A4X2_9BACT|nr:TonB-dependent receptor [Hymenobacter jejuensis]QDA61635.1 TonB-dependent receptor [Hymenobacter jejuensis]
MSLPPTQSGKLPLRAPLLLTGALLLYSSSAQVVAQAMASVQHYPQRSASAGAVPLKQLLKHWEKQYNTIIAYDSDLVGDKRVAPQENVGTLEDKLATVLPQVGLRFKKLHANNYIITPDNSTTTEPSLEGLAANVATLQDVTVSGRVVQSNGEALPGVTIIVKGTVIGASTGGNGEFSLSVPENSTLVVSAVGFLKQEIAVQGATSALTITLAEDRKTLDEVVVVGYGTQKKGDVTGAIASFDAKALNERPIARVDQALVGQLAGVQVKQTTGVPGQGFSVQVRGSGSITANNEPLYVIDGFPLESTSQNAAGRFGAGSPLDNINPNDIEKIEVLKDAAAAAIYGSRAANGVVIITTKKGKSGKPQFTVNSYVGVSEKVRGLDMLSADEWVDRAIEIINASWVSSGPGRTASQTTAQRQAILGNTTINPNLMIDERWTQPGHPGLTYIDWQKEAFKKGVAQNYQIGASGSTDFVNYYISGDYLKQDGIMIGLGYKRYSARANVEVKVTPKLKLGLNLSPSYSITHDPGIEGKDNQLQYLTFNIPVAEASAGLDANTGNILPYTWGGRPSPIRGLENTTGDTRSFRTLSTLYADYQLLPGLNLRSTLNLDNTDGNTKNYRPAFVSGSVGSRQASGYYDGYKKLTFVNENTLSYNKLFREKHDFTFLAGYSYNTTKIDGQRLTAANGFINNAVTTINGATTVSGTTDNYTTETRNVLISTFGRLQYSYEGKYLFSGSIRRDGSSRFGENDKYGVFPAASVGWRVSQEKFMPKQDVLSDLKLRASIGLSGNNGIGDYSSIATLGVFTYSSGGTLIPGQAPNRINNPNLKWERSRTVDFGVDFGLINNRVTGSLDYYTKTSRDLLLNVPVPATAGFATQLTNIGEVLNKGWEVEINSHNLIGKFQWSTGINVSHNRNRVVHLGPNDAPILVSSGWDIQNNILQVGQPLYAIYAIKTIGILSQADIDNKVARFGTESAGDAKYQDANGDGKIDANDRQIVGQPSPKYTWGVTNNFRYKGFDLTVLVQGQQGGSIYSLFGRAVDRTGTTYSENILGLNRDRWRSADNPGAGERGKAYSTFGYTKTTDWLYSSDYYRVRQITLGYDLGLLIKKSVAQGVRIYVSAENYFGHDKYYGGYNPESVNTNGGDSSFPIGVDYGGLPLAKTLTLGLNLTF